MEENDVIEEHGPSEKLLNGPQGPPSNSSKPESSTKEKKLSTVLQDDRSNQEAIVNGVS